jgi:cell division protein FtsZ
MAKIEFEKTMELMDEVDELDVSGYDVTIKVVGVGGGGGNALEFMAKNMIEGVDYLAVNTDVPALRNKDKTLMRRLQIGKKRTKGRGAGGNPEVGCESALEDRQAIEALLEGTSMVFVSAGMGGGTGTGAAPVISEISKSMGILTIGVVTKPFDFERPTKMNTALKGIVEMRKHVDSLIIIPNQALLAMNEQALNAKSAFEMVDNVLYKVVKSIAEVLNTTGQINVDFADLESILKDSGDAHIAIGVGSGDDKANVAVEAVINSPLLETSINNAGKMLVYILMSPDATLLDVDLICAKLTAAAHLDVEVIMGYDFDVELKDTISVTVVATSFRDDTGLPRGREQQEAAAPEVPKPAEPKESGNPLNFSEAHSAYATPRGETLDGFITQSIFNESPNDDPYKDLEKIFNR